jgi:hypothetical protein
MNTKPAYRDNLLFRCFEQAVSTCVEYVLQDDIEVDADFARQSVQESYPVIEKLSVSLSAKHWVLEDISDRSLREGLDGEDHCLLLKQAFAQMANERNTVSARYLSAKYVLEFITTQYQECGYKLD